MNELEKFLEQLFREGLLSLADGSKPSVEIAISQIQKLVEENKTLTDAKTMAEKEVADLKEENTSLKNEAKANEKMVEVGKLHLSEVRNQAIASYKKLQGEDKVDANILALLEAETTNLETLVSLKATYDAQLEEKFPLHCANCGSKDINRASSMENQEDEDKKNHPASIRETISNLAKNKLK